MPALTRSSSSSLSTTSSLSFINEFIAKDKARRELQKLNTLRHIPSLAHHVKPMAPGPGEITRCDKLTQASIALLQDYGLIKQQMREDLLSRRNSTLVHSIYCTIAGLKHSMHAAKECHTLANDIETWLERLPSSRASPLKLGVGLRLKMLADRFTRRAARMADYFYHIFIEMDTIIKDYKATSDNPASGDQNWQLIILSHTLKHCLAQYVSFWSKVSKHMFPIYIYAKRYPYFIPSPQTSAESPISDRATRQKLDLFEGSQGCRAASGTFALYMFRTHAQLLDQFPNLFMEARKFKSYYTR